MLALSHRRSTFQNNRTYAYVGLLNVNSKVYREQIEPSGAEYPYFLAGILFLVSCVTGLGHIIIATGDITEAVSFSWKVGAIIVIALAWGVFNLELRHKK